MEKMTASEYLKMLKDTECNKSIYRVAPKPERTWIGFWRGRKQTIVFDSKREMQHCVSLILQERAGNISSLRFQEPFRMTDTSSSEKMQSYYVDYCYFIPSTGKWIAGDVKSSWTAKDQKYINKRKLLKEKFSAIEFEEIIL